MALSLEMDTGRYVKLMEKLIGEVEHLQNNPPRFVPQEDRRDAIFVRLFVSLYSLLGRRW